jgi:multidrug resistance protein, MATE family
MHAYVVQGLWMGQICGLLCQNCILFFITQRTNWQELDLTMFNKDNDFVC